MTEYAEFQQDPERAYESPDSLARFFLLQIDHAERVMREYHDIAHRTESRYKADRQRIGFTTHSNNRKRRTYYPRQFAVLYSNTELLKAALLSGNPKPDVRRRNMDRNPIAREAAKLVERVLSYSADNTDHDRAYKRAAQDLSLVGRGVVWLEYEPKIEEIEVERTVQTPFGGLSVEIEAVEDVTDQQIKERHVYWRDFLYSPCRQWCDVWWVARRHRMTREDLRENEFEDWREIPLNWSPDGSAYTSQNQRSGAGQSNLRRAEVWEVWDKNSKRRIWVSPGWRKALRVDDDPYELEGFFPCAEPMWGAMGTDELVPVPDFVQYSDQAADLDETTARISILTKAMRRRGVYNSAITQLKRISQAGDNEFVPIDGQMWQNMATSGGLVKMYEVEDLKPMADVLVQLYQNQDYLLQKIYEISGIGDLLRGVSDPRTTATAERTKAGMGSIRIQDRMIEVQRFIRDSYRIKAELIVERFKPEILAQMGGYAPDDPKFQAVYQLLQSDKIRGYLIDIETENTAFDDAQQEKRDRAEVVAGITQLVQQWAPLVAQDPTLVNFTGELLHFAVAPFKASRPLIDAIDEMVETQKRQAQQRMSQPPPPDPKMIEAQARAQKWQADAQLSQQKAGIAQIEAQADMASAQADVLGTQLDAQGQSLKNEGFMLDNAGKIIDLETARQTAGIDAANAELDAQLKAQNIVSTRIQDALDLKRLREPKSGQ